MFYTKISRFWAIQIALKQMSNSVKCKIYCRIRKWFYNILVVKRQFGAQSKWSGTSPLLQPFYSINQIIMKSLTVTFELSFNIIQYFFLPFFITIIDVPLIAIWNDTLITRSWNDFGTWLIIFESQSIINHLFLDQIFSLWYFYAFIITNNHYTFMETFFITFLFCLI